MTNPTYAARARWRHTTIAGCVAALVALVTMAPASDGAAQTLQELYQKAKAEGAVTVIGPPSVTLRNALTAAFSRDFPGITLEYSGMMGNAAAAKLRAEQRAGVSTADMVIAGASTGLRLLKPEGYLAPLPPLMVPSTVAEKAQWRGGDFTWADESDKTVILLTGLPGLVATINTDLVKPGELTRDSDLLDPKWKGKLASHNPLLPGSGAETFHIFYKLHGPEFIRRLVVDQELVFIKDVRRLADGVAHGRYPIAIGLVGTISSALIKQGVTTIKPLSSKDWKDPLRFTPGFGCVMMLKEASHPAAAQLFFNWLLSRGGLEAFGRGLTYATLRRDVPADYIPEFVRMYDDATYLEAYSEEFANDPVKKKLHALLAELNVR